MVAGVPERPRKQHDSSAGNESPRTVLEVPRQEKTQVPSRREATQCTEAETQEIYLNGRE